MLNKKHTILIAAILLTILTTANLAYAQEPLETPTINTEISLENAIIILSIGLVGAIVTSLEGQHRSGTKFELGKFFIAVKRTAAISIPSTFGLLALYPEPTYTDYLLIGLVIVLGAKMIHTKKPSLDLAKNNTELEFVTVSKTTREVLVTVPKLGPESEWFQTNFVKTEKGNTLPFGQNLWIRIKDVRSYVTAKLSDSKGNVIQIDQSHQFDEDNNIETTRLEMFGRDAKPLPRGKYTLQTQGDRGTGDAQGIKADEFEIV